MKLNESQLRKLVKHIISESDWKLSGGPGYYVMQAYGNLPDEALVTGTWAPPSVSRDDWDPHDPTPDLRAWIQFVEDPNLPGGAPQARYSTSQDAFLAGPFDSFDDASWYLEDEGWTLV